MKKRPIVLCIMDGYGISESINGNAVRLANTPNLDDLISKLGGYSVIQSCDCAVCCDRVVRTTFNRCRWDDEWHHCNVCAHLRQASTVARTVNHWATPVVVMYRSFTVSDDGLCDTQKNSPSDALVMGYFIGNRDFMVKVSPAW